MNRSVFIGIDLGTSAVKLLLVDQQGTVLNTVSREYPLYFPEPGWSEQDPADWWTAVRAGVRELTAGFDASKVAGIGCGGQMHGLVALDGNDNVIRPAILWNDGRTAEETVWLNTAVGKRKLSDLTANIAFAGFTAPKLLWMQKHEPDKFARIAKIMLPKDYINYMLTGVHACDFSDASGMLLLDVKHRCWSKEMLDICGVKEAQMPKLFESYEVIGTVLPEIAAELGLPMTVKVVAGAGDNAAAAVGTGVVGEGGCNISLGTSGTLFISSRSFGADPHNALHAFCHADGGWHLMGCMLHGRPWYLRRSFFGHRPDRHGPGCVGRRGLCPAGQSGGSQGHRPFHRPQLSLRRRGEISPVAEDPGQCPEHFSGHPPDRGGPGLRRGHAGHGGHRGLWERPGLCRRPLPCAGDGIARS